MRKPQRNRLSRSRAETWKPHLSQPWAEEPIIALLASMTSAEAPGSGKGPGNSGPFPLSAQESWSSSVGLPLPRPAVFVEGVLLEADLWVLCPTPTVAFPCEGSWLLPTRVMEEGLVSSPPILLLPDFDSSPSCEALSTETNYHSCTTLPLFFLTSAMRRPGHSGPFLEDLGT